MTATPYLIVVLTRLLHDLGLWNRRFVIASKVAKRPIRSLDELSTQEQHALIRGLRCRILAP